MLDGLTGFDVGFSLKNGTPVGFCGASGGDGRLCDGDVEDFRLRGDMEWPVELVQDEEDAA